MAGSHVYAKITDRIIAELEKGVLPWRKPWDADHLALGRPLRSTGEAYRGINRMLLWMAAASNGYACNTWFTFNQVQTLGGRVRKGEKSEAIIFFLPVSETVVDKVTGEETEEHSAIVRPYNVFNGQQCDGLPAKFFETVVAPVVTAKERHEASERFFANTGAEFRHGGDKAFYAPHLDFIQLPPFETFRDTESYVGTKAHELVHWTMHEKRCKRNFSSRFGSDAYAQEELVAEIGACFLDADLGISPTVRDDHTQYLGHWLKIMKGDRGAIVTAASQAEKAVQFLHGLQGRKFTAEGRDDFLGAPGQYVGQAA